MDIRYEIDEPLLATLRMHGGDGALLGALRPLTGGSYGEDELLLAVADGNSSDPRTEAVRLILRAAHQAIADGKRLLERAHRCHMDGLVGDAIQLYKRVLRTAPSAEAHILLGWAYSFQNRYTEAISQCENAIGLDPDFGKPYHDIGVYLIALQQPDQAIPWLRRALAAHRCIRSHHAWADLGRAYEKLNLTDKAFEAYYRAWELDPENSFARKALNRLCESGEDWN